MHNLTLRLNQERFHPVCLDGQPELDATFRTTLWLEVVTLPDEVFSPCQRLNSKTKTDWVVICDLFAFETDPGKLPECTWAGRWPRRCTKGATMESSELRMLSYIMTIGCHSFY